jgi:hypothetical protein
MNTPSFTAEVSLYRSSGRYRTGRPATTLPTRMNYRTGRHARNLPRRTNSLRLALDEGEVIVVRDCRPGWVKLSEGVCVRDPSLPGGGAPPGTPDEPGAEPPPPPGGGTGPGQPPDKPVPEKTPTQPIRKPYNPREGNPCHAEYILMEGTNAKDWRTIVKTGKYAKVVGGEYKFVCEDAANGKILECRNGKPIVGDDNVDWRLCFDAHRP